MQNAPVSKKSELAFQLTQLYLSDQDLEMAFNTYLKALQSAPRLPEPVPSADEMKHYDEALKIYLDHNGASPTEIALALRDKLESVLKEHPDYYLANFLMAVAYANVSLYKEFFQSFYSSYQHYPEHFLAYKTQAILHIKLFERVRTHADKEMHRLAIKSLVEKASNKNSKDTGLYKLMMIFASDKEKPAIVNDCLNKILKDPMIIARGDIAFFVQQAVSVNRSDLAQQLIDKAQELFEYSRVVLAAQQYLDNHKKGKSTDE